MSGEGSFDKDSGALNQGGGIFQIFDFSSTVPKAVIESGTWQATKLVSYTEAGTWGSLASGTAVFQIELTLSDGTTQQATLTVVCDLAPAGLSTGNGPGGITVVIGSNTLAPLNGLTVFSLSS